MLSTLLWIVGPIFLLILIAALVAIFRIAFGSVKTKTPSASVSPSVADELSKLASLKAQGVLTDDEFNLKKKSLLEKA